MRRAGGENGYAMAKGKGKSKRRRRGWGQRYAAGEDVDDAAASKAKFAPRAVKLPAHRPEAPQANLDELPKAEGMVVGLFPGGAAARVGGQVLLCGIAKTFRAPEGTSALAVGDVATIALAAEHHDAAAHDKDRADGMVLARAPRRSALCRPQVTSGKHRDEYESQTIEKIIVANMDAVLIVASTREPPLRPAPIDRFLIVAERGELAPILAVSKTDLAAPDEQVLGVFRGLGVPIYPCSARTREGLEALAAAMAGKQVVLAGASGVGKSALVNALVPGAGAATREIRRKDQRGRHTTSAAVVYELPGGGLLVDTPGVREIGIHLTAAELPWYFPEFEQRMNDCRFRNCTHTHEPGCAVQAAVETGEIPARRYESYLRILDSLDG